MRKPLIAGNWKMYKTVHDAVSYITELRRTLRDVVTVDIVVAPPFTALAAAADRARDSRIAISAQNLHWERDGAFTGEVSAGMIHEAGAQYVIIGHSERRTLFGETNLSVNKKLGAALAADLCPIVCVGETLQQRQANQTHAVLDQQLREGLDGFTAEQLDSMIVAYEPVWAIGTGHNATPEQAQDAHAHIRGRLRQWFGADMAERCRILYGGSVKPDNTAALMAQPDAIVHDADGHRGAFRIDLDGKNVAAMTYTLAGATLIIIDHTEVDASLRGTGAGQALVEAAVQWARANGKRIMPLCPFARSVFDRTPEFGDVRR
jgi:triosephosphate isomerase